MLIRFFLTLLLLTIPLKVISEPRPYFDSQLAKKYSVVTDELLEAKNRAGSLFDLNIHFLSKLCKEGSYQIDFNDEKVDVSGCRDGGIIHGLSRLENMLLSDGRLPLEGKVVSTPEIAYRYVHLNIHHKTPVYKVKKQVRRARLAYFNGIVIQVKNNVRFEYNSQWVKSGAWTTAQLQELIQYAHSSGFKIIPEISLLTHQELFIRDESLLLNNRTYDPDNENVYKHVYSALNELIKHFQPEALHIGHDELHGYQNKKIALLTWKKATAKQFEQDVNRIYDYLSERGVKT